MPIPCLGSAQPAIPSIPTLEVRNCEIAPFRLVFIDVDLYRPVLKALRATYDLVSAGGTIIIDDCMPGGEWGGAYDGYIEFAEEKGLEPVITNGVGVITKLGARG